MKYIWLILILLAFISGCFMGESTTPCKCPSADTVTIVHHTIDTVEGATKNHWYAKHDTMWIVNFDTVPISDSDCDSVRLVVTASADSSVTVESTVHGKLLGQVIHGTSKETIINHYSPVQNRTSWLIGVDAGLNHVAPKVTMIRNRGYYSAGYDVITGSPVVGFGIKLR